jgi:hypothetical protein
VNPPDPYRRVTEPFLLDGEPHFVEVAGVAQYVRLRRASGEVVEETVRHLRPSGCYIEEIVASPSGRWLVTQNFSGQGEWGYDVFRTRPLARVGGIVEERGYILEPPCFSDDDSLLVGGGGEGFLGGWWAHPEDDNEDPARGGPVEIGFVFVHDLLGRRVTRHPLRIDLPAGWQPDDPWGEWYGPRPIGPVNGGIWMMPSWGVPVEVSFPLPEVIWLPVPHPSGKGLLSAGDPRRPTAPDTEDPVS